MLKPNLNELIVCRNLLNDKTFAKLAAFFSDTQNTELEHELISALIYKAEKHGLSGNIFASYTLYLITQGDNIAALMSERSGSIGKSLKKAFLNDTAALYQLINLKPGDVLNTDILDDYQPTANRAAIAFKELTAKTALVTSPESLADTFLDYYQTYGYGAIANYRAFSWNDQNQLCGIKHFAEQTLSELIGYEYQKSQLIQNTEAFLEGKPANNVLLVGARGTGKSSAVKALANEYFSKRLRILQLTKKQLISMPKIMETLRLLSSKKFIIFLDDLSFEDFEVEYKYLKSAIEGGVESKPDNVLIYATSNRRHLIKESARDRGDIGDDLHRNDSINETISLSDRFGLTIFYTSPNQQEYFDIIDGLLRQHNIILDEKTLRAEAVQWEQSHSGRSGRVAQQFVNHYLGTH